LFFIFNIAFKIRFIKFRGKKPTDNLDISIHHIGDIIANASHSNDWFQRNMQSDPVKTFTFIAYFLLLAISIQIMFYSKWEKNEKWKMKHLKTVCGNTVSPVTEPKMTLRSEKFTEHKSMILGAGDHFIEHFVRTFILVLKNLIRL
jgi:hypothetical protein